MIRVSNTGRAPTGLDVADPSAGVAMRPARFADYEPEPNSPGPYYGDQSRVSAPPKRRGPTPYVTYLLLAVNIIVFMLMYHASAGHVEQVTGLFGDKDDTLIRQGQFWRLITAMFLHGSVTHIGVNGFSLYIFGTQMERIYGARKYFIIYMVAGIVGYLVSFLHSPNPSVGASGAIFGLVGAGLVFPLRFKSLVNPKARSQILSQLVFITILNLGFGFSDKAIDNSAHIGGLIGGGLAALFLIPDVLERTPRRASVEALLSATCAALLVLTVWAAGMQWRWATRQETTVTAGGTDPWWSIRVPSEWARKADKHEWTTPGGGQVDLLDSATDPDDINAVAERLKKVGADATSVEVDGKPAKHFGLKSGNYIWECYVLEPYPNRIIALTFTCQTDAFETIDSSFQLAATTLRFIHPPDSTE